MIKNMTLFRSIISLSLFMTFVNTAAILPPQSGKFFYVDMEAGGQSSAFDDHGLHFMDLLVSNSTPAVPTNQYHISINT